MRHRLIIVGALILAIGLFWFLRPTCPVTAANFAKIQRGMSARQVQAILGGQAGDYSSHAVEYSWIEAHAPKGTAEEKFWIGNDGVARVCFDEAGTVLFSEFLKTTPHPESLVRRLRRWLGI